jgi:NADPH:quinone reductase-like Zn-dependent oxidoreductase
MRAAYFDRYGSPDVIAVREVPTPKPGPREVRIAVRATTATAACGMMRRGDTAMARVLLGALRPRRRFRILGIELCGVVDRVGTAVARFKEGDRVFGFAGFRPGAYAEYMCLPEDASVAPAPQHLSDLEAVSLVDGPTTALYFLRDRLRVGPQTRIVVVGASGSIGTAAVQLARHFGAHVTGVCSGANVDLVRSLGAHDVVDYTREDFTLRGRRYDVVFDTVGASSFSAASRCLVDGGAYAPTVGGVGLFALDLLTRGLTRTRLVFGMSIDKRGKLHEVAQLSKGGALRPIIDRCYSLAEIPEAHRYVETRRKRGNVVITLAPR